jgi:hypothetical protein
MVVGNDLNVEFWRRAVKGIECRCVGFGRGLGLEAKMEGD